MFKKFFAFNKLLLFASLGTLMFCFNAPQNDDEKMQTIMVSVMNTLSYLHYSPKPINDAYSADVYTKYFDKIDPAKRFLLQSDMDEFNKHRYKLDDYLKMGDLGFYKLTVDRLYKRMDEIDKITQEIMSRPINLDEDEVLVLEPKKRTNPANQAQLRDEWRKFIKYNILQEIETLNSKEQKQREKKDSVQKHNLQDTLKLEILTPEQKRVKATGEVKDYITEYFKRFKKRKKMNWFTVYMNSYTEVFDPHTNYFSPQDKEDFDAGFSGKITGIGAQISEKKGYLYIGPLVIGAPAWKSKQVTEGDKILKVKPDPKSEAVNVVGMLVDEAVRLIRGKKGTEVVLTLQKKDGTTVDVKMVREEVEMEDTFAKSIVFTNGKGEKYGLISLPSFNAELDNPKGRNASTDVRNELEKLKKENVRGVILDIRNNGGGSLTEVVDIMGLFMNNGPVVQIKNGDGKVQVLQNRTNNPTWTGPLVILQNELSASASEILSGAIRDYGRGVVVGAPHSFGKGTVQTFVPLNRFLNSSDDYGNLKLTVQKFYRVSGKSTQLRGVDSDIVMNDFFTYDEIGEKYDDFALPWDQIQPTKFTPLAFPNLKTLIANSQQRLQANKNYLLLQESAEWRRSLDKEESIPLNQAKFEALMAERKQQIKKYEALRKFDNGLKFALLPGEKARLPKDEAFAKKSENWMKMLKRDLYVQEAANVISEMK